MNGLQKRNESPKVNRANEPPSISHLNTGLNADDDQSSVDSSIGQSIGSSVGSKPSVRSRPNLTIQTRPNDNQHSKNLVPIDDRSPTVELRRCALDNKHTRPDCCTFGLFYQDPESVYRLVHIQSINSKTTL